MRECPVCVRENAVCERVCVERVCCVCESMCAESVLRVCAVCVLSVSGSHDSVRSAPPVHNRVGLSRASSSRG